MKHYEVSAAIVIDRDRVFCAQRGKSKFYYISEKYEFPGGKIEHGETKEEALKREMLEEFNMEIEVKEHLLTVEHKYPDFSLTMHCFTCKRIGGIMTLKEHLDFKWLTFDRLDTLDWAEADLPVVEKLKELKM